MLSSEEVQHSTRYYTSNMVLAALRRVLNEKCGAAGRTNMQFVWSEVLALWPLYYAGQGGGRLHGRQPRPAAIQESAARSTFLHFYNKRATTSYKNLNFIQRVTGASYLAACLPSQKHVVQCTAASHASRAYTFPVAKLIGT